MDMAPSGNGRFFVSLLIFALIAVMVGRTMQPGKLQQLTWLLVGFFAARTVLTRFRSR